MTISGSVAITLILGSIFGTLILIRMFWGVELP